MGKRTLKEVRIMKNTALRRSALLILLVFCTLFSCYCHSGKTTDSPKNSPTPPKDFSEFAMDLTDASGKAGDEITVSLQLLENPSIAGYSVTVVYDPAILTFVKNENKVSGGFHVVNSQTEGKVRVMCTVMGGNVLSTNGVSDVLTFRIKDDAKAGSYPLDLLIADNADSIYIINPDNTMPDVPCKLSGGSVTVQ